jgi:hypothetical protein
MLSSVKVSTTPVGVRHLEKMILATSAGLASDGSDSSPHRYLDDFKPFSSVFTVYNVSMQLAKAALLPTNILLNDFNTYMDQFGSNPDFNDEIPPYDWDTAINKFLNSFVFDGCRFFITSVLRKVFEEYALHNYSMKFSDQLTKDISKSLVRKSIRLGDDQRLEVCRRMFFTSFRASSLTYVSFLVYDSALITFQHLRVVYKAIFEDKKDLGNALWAFDLPSLIVKIVKKSVFQLTSLSAQAAGYATGSYFNLKYGGTVGSAVFEILAGLLLSQFITTNDDPVQLRQVHQQIDDMKRRNARARESKKKSTSK